LERLVAARSLGALCCDVSRVRPVQDPKPWGRYLGVQLRLLFIYLYFLQCICGNPFLYLEGVSDTRYPELSAQASRYLPFSALQAAVFGLGPSHRVCIMEMLVELLYAQRPKVQNI